MALDGSIWIAKFPFKHEDIDSGVYKVRVYDMHREERSKWI